MARIRKQRQRQHARAAEPAASWPRRICRLMAGIIPAMPSTPREGGLALSRTRAYLHLLRRGHPRAARSRSAWRAPVRLDHPPHEEDEDELRRARGGAARAPNSRRAGLDGTQSDDGAVAAGRADPIAGFWQAGRRCRVHGSHAAGPAPRVAPPPDRWARRIARHGNAELAARARGVGRALKVLNAVRAGRGTLGSRPGTRRSTSQT